MKNRNLSDKKIILFSPGYFHAREELFLALNTNFNIKIVDISHNKKNGTPSKAYKNNNIIWNFNSAKLGRIGILEFIKLSLRIFKLLLKEKPYLVICSTQYNAASITTHYLKKIMKFKLAYVVEVWTPVKLSPIVRLFHLLSDHILKQSDFILVEGKKSLDYMINTYKQSPSKCFPWSLTSEDIAMKPVIKSKNLEHIFRKYKNNIIFGYVGRFDSQKGLNELLQCFEEELICNKNISLFLVGGRGNMEDKIKIYSEKYPQIISIKWITPEYLPFIYRSIDIFILPTYYDGYSTVTSEAASMSLPLLISDMAGCTSDLLINDKNGEIFKARDIISLKFVIRKWSLMSKTELKQRGKLSRELFLKHSDFRLHVNSLNKILT